MTDAALARIGEKVSAHEPLTDADIEMLTGTGDLLVLGALADERRRARRGGRVTFVRVLDVESPSGNGASGPEVPAGAGEVRLSGSFSDVDRAVAAVAWVRAAAADVPVTGFVLDEVAAACGGGATALREILAALRAAGLSALAEARVERLDGPELVAVAAEAGVPVARLTMDGASGEATGLERLRRVAGWGSAVTSVGALAPLARTVETEATTGYCDLRQVALARLLVDNIESIQVDWGRYGPKLAQVALTFGADDVDAVSPYDPAEQGRRRAPLAEITRNIRAAGLTPVERNGRFEAR